MIERRQAKSGFGWRNQELREDQRLQLVLLDALSWVSTLSEELKRCALDPTEILTPAGEFQQNALDFLLKLDPSDFGDAGDERSAPIPGQRSIFDAD